jgi:hypothetical protein
MEIDMSHCDRKWKYSEESVAACAQKQRRQKKNKDDLNITGYKQVVQLGLGCTHVYKGNHPFT